MNIRELREDELEDFIALDLEYIMETSPAYTDDYVLEHSFELKSFLNSYKSRFCILYVIEENGHLVGQAILVTQYAPPSPNLSEGMFGRVYHLYIKKAYRGRDYMRRFLYRLQEEAQTANMQMLEIETSNQMYSFCASCGFKKLSGVVMRWLNPC